MTNPVLMAAGAAVLVAEGAADGTAVAPETAVRHVYEGPCEAVIADAAHFDRIAFETVARRERALRHDVVRDTVLHVSSRAITEVNREFGGYLIGACTFSAIALQMLAAETGRDVGELASEILERTS